MSDMKAHNIEMYDVRGLTVSRLSSFFEHELNELNEL